MTDDLVAFLRARLDEDEQTALAAGNRRWLVQDNIIELYPERDDDGFMSWPTRFDAQHAARHDPARVLRRVAADRLNVDEYERYLAERRRAMGGWDTGEASPVMRALAAVYADHPDYRSEEWGP